ncbi:MAG: hypothetical protein KF724_12430 [Phycisphaeraceae bacterium]|nr:hypothetical protein [Phycisphaeraceae bacterium]
MSDQRRRSPASLDIDDLVRLLRASGSRQMSAERVRADIDAGAPTNPDGTINLVHYGAWLVRQVMASEALRGH